MLKQPATIQANPQQHHTADKPQQSKWQGNQHQQGHKQVHQQLLAIAAGPGAVLFIEKGVAADPGFITRQKDHQTIGQGADGDKEQCPPLLCFNLQVTIMPGEEATNAIGEQDIPRPDKQAVQRPKEHQPE